MSDKVPIRRLPTGVPDSIPSWAAVCPSSRSMSLPVRRAPARPRWRSRSCSLARADRPAIFFTVLGEPPLKMLRYQQQLEFFDLAKVNASVRFVNLPASA